MIKYSKRTARKILEAWGSRMPSRPAIDCSHQKIVVRLEMLYAQTRPPDPDKDNFIAQPLYLSQASVWE